MSNQNHNLLLCSYPRFDNISLVCLQAVLVSEGLLEEVGQLLLRPTCSSVIITHSCRIITGLSGCSEGQQAVTEARCSSGLLGALLSPS
ncbi:hypothetical protein KUCAC02_032814 [Chaenocephalus aceratus]|nr:hypothetical protein KUCAC02_032814 [Chaenocephalus aceratus]